MIRRALALVLALVALVVAWPAHAQVARPVHETRLANGLRLVISPDPAAADVSVHVRYDTGARDEPAGLEGLAHLVEHLMFLGTRRAPLGMFWRLLEQSGASDLNGETSIDDTDYYETVAPERLALALWLEADRMAEALDGVDEATLSRAKAEVRNERRERITERPLGELTGLMHADLFPSWHPYHHLPIGTVASIDSIKLADAQAFARTWYGPANAALVIAGKVDPRAAFTLVERYFGGIPGRTPPVRPVVPVPTRATTVLRMDANVTRSEVRLAWVTPPFGAPGDLELDLAAAILVNRGSGWLESLLFRSPRLASNVVAGQRSMRLSSVFEIEATVSDGRSLREVKEAIAEALARFDAGVSDDDIQRARRAFENRKLFNLESSGNLAYALALWTPFGALPSTFDAGLSRYRVITPAAVRAAVRRWLGTQPWVAASAVPNPRRPVAGEITDRKGVPF